MNKKIAIVTHGHLATGFESALNLLVGEQADVQLKAIAAYLSDEEDWQETLNTFFTTPSPQDLNIIFTDLYGGSVNQNAFLAYGDAPVTIITGTNLPVIMEILLTPFADISDFQKNLPAILEGSRTQLRVTKAEETNEDFFD
ncbi:hypothetical protein BAU15_05505 [Enterococcus sp. JM4C]|uniref:PTS sugar transporter subunit IIA n=1 Tax=Candidatus Enterococcus huntleyi TaxID=1857217 RepID=UPI00137B56A7|nr:hypothetical protein [Enterococcus sp. JM4C]KAF1295207.1 hypothetical protein BAU15_05505 [Enterococcus sp. JM4C]